MKKVNIPGSAIFGFALFLVCLFGFLKNTFDLKNSIIIIAVGLIVLIILFFFSLKNVYTTEKDPEDYTKKQSKSKFKASAEKDTVHMKRLLETYQIQLEDIRRKSRNGLIYAGALVVFDFIMWGIGNFAFSFFLLFLLVCIVYAGVCIWTLYLNSDDPEAGNVARKLNISTHPMMIEDTEDIIWMNDMERQQKLMGIEDGDDLSDTERSGEYID